MTKQITDAELEALVEFETRTLLDAVDQVDVLRGHLNDRDGFAPPEIRTELLKLHGLAMDVVNNGFTSRAEEMFDLANELSDQIFDMTEALERVRDVVGKLVDLRPDSLDDDFTDDDEASE